MLHSSNLDDSKSEWNGTHIIIPMIEGDVIGNKDSDKSLRNTITLNSVDGGDETVLTNGLEHSLVIGLDRNLFEANSNKSDLLVIQNTDLKLLSYSSESKNPVTYTLSYVDQDKSEIFRESSFLKDRIRSDWCSNNKSIFEVKDALNYDNAVLDSSKNWNNEKNEHFALDDDLTSNVSKIDGELLIPVEDTINADKKLEDVVENPHFIVNYFPAIQSSETVSLMSNHTIMNSSKPIENMVGGKSKVTNLNLVQNELLFSRIIEQLHLNELLSEGCSKNLKEIKGNTLAKQEEYYEATVYSDKSEENNHYETNMKADFSEESLLNVNKVNCKDEKVVLPERSLPPKKKAKMKSTIVPSWCKNFSFSINYEATAIKNENNCTKAKNIKKWKSSSKDNSENYYSSNSDSNEPLINKIFKKKKIKQRSETNINEIKMMKDQVFFNSLVNTHHQSKKTSKIVSKKYDSKTSEHENTINSKLIMQTSNNFNKKKFKNIFDLLEDLKKLRLINASVWEILCLGLKEMNVDILKEMNLKHDAVALTSSTSYSAQLKAFALVLYFKQPAAFNHLAKLYKKGWPSLNVIKEWKRKVNSHQKPKSVRKEKEQLKL